MPGVYPGEMKRKTHRMIPALIHPRSSSTIPTSLGTAMPEEGLTSVRNEVSQIGWTGKALYGCQWNQEVKAVELRMKETIGNIISYPGNMLSFKSYVLKLSKRRGSSRNLVDDLNNSYVIRPENHPLVAQLLAPQLNGNNYRNKAR